MKSVRNIAVISMLLAAPVAQSGVINNGVWTPVGCGEKPATPLIADQDAKAFNKSMDTLGEWQNQVKQYFECMVKEANGDNAVIAESANRLQAEHQKAVEAVNSSIDAAEKKLTKK